MKALIPLLLLLTPQLCLANANLGTDRVQDNDGTRCESSNIPTAMIEAGVMGGRDMYRQNNGLYHGYYDPYHDEGRIYAGIAIPIGVPEQVDCNRLFDNIMAKKDLELEKLQAELEMLKTQQSNYTFSE